MRGKRIEGFVTREQALKDFFAAWEPPERTELVPLSKAAWRITAEPLFSVNTLPICRVSGCDGIAVHARDFFGGMPDYALWTEGREFVRADTGDDFPDGFDAVIPIEEVDFSPDGRIRFISGDIDISEGSNVRPAGSTVQEGDRLIGESLPLRPTDLAALAMGGVAMVPVRSKPRIAFLPTGTELVPQGYRPQRGQNVDTNSILVSEMLKKMGADPVLFPITPDEPEALEHVIRKALSVSDMVLVNAGTSRGGEDFNFSLLEKMGALIHHYIAAAPGRPMALAVIDGKPVINLPGPTMAAFFGMDWCVRPTVARFLHIPPQQRQRVTGILTKPIHSTPHMAILVRMHAVCKGDEYLFTPLSFRTEPLADSLTSNALYVCDVGESEVEAGTEITAELLRSEEFISE